MTNAGYPGNVSEYGMPVAAAAVPMKNYPAAVQSTPNPSGHHSSYPSPELSSTGVPTTPMSGYNLHQYGYGAANVGAGAPVMQPGMGMGMVPAGYTQSNAYHGTPATNTSLAYNNRVSGNNRIGNYPGSSGSSTGYVPPVAITPQQQRQQQVGTHSNDTNRANSCSNVSSAFDFLN
jgi:hypothetical protein